MRPPVRLTPQHPLRKLIAAINIGILATVAVVGLHRAPKVDATMSGLDEALYDGFYNFRMSEDRTDGPIVIVTADDNSVEKLASLHHIHFPFPRALWGQAAQYVESMHARAVLFDITFALPTSDDEDFADELDSLKIPLVMANTFAEGKQQPFAPKLKKRPLFGAVNVLDDKVVRNYQTTVDGIPSLALRTVQTLGLKPSVPEQMRLHYYGPTERIENNRKRYTYQYVSAWAVFTAAQAPQKAASLGLTPDMFRNKIVIFGATSHGSYDLKSTPLSKEYPGVELHATAIDNLLNGQTVETVGTFPSAMMAFAACFLGGLGVLFPRRATLKAAAALIVSIAVVLAAVAMFRAEQIRWIPMATPLTALIATIISAFAWSYLKEDRQRRFVVKALSQYLSPEIADEIEKSDSALKLGGERREITVLFTDLQGFTDLSESLAPEKLATVINYYMSEMSAVILANNGTVAQYLGDGIMAFWSAPIVQPDHAIRACRAALGMRNREIEIRAELAELGAKNTVTRIGVNTGPMVFGNLGSRQKFSYGVLGDNVNLGSRLEGANKLYGSRILLAESTALAVQDHFVVRQLDMLRVKGKLRAVGVYELMTETPAGPETIARVEGYSRALVHYHNQKWDEAQAILKELICRFPEDRPVEALMKRIEKLRHDPPPPDWDGVYIAKDK